MADETLYENHMKRSLKSYIDSSEDARFKQVFGAVLANSSKMPLFISSLFSAIESQFDFPISKFDYSGQIINKIQSEKISIPENPKSSNEESNPPENVVIIEGVDPKELNHINNNFISADVPIDLPLERIKETQPELKLYIFGHPNIEPVLTFKPSISGELFRSNIENGYILFTYINQKYLIKVSPGSQDVSVCLPESQITSGQLYIQGGSIMKTKLKKKGLKLTYIYSSGVKSNEIITKEKILFIDKNENINPYRTESMIEYVKIRKIENSWWIESLNPNYTINRRIHTMGSIKNNCESYPLILKDKQVIAISGYYYEIKIN